MTYKIKINGETRELSGELEQPLLWALRDDLGLTGTKFGCGMAQCGACTVHVDGQPQRACTLSLAAVGAREVVTIEAVAGREASELKAAWIKHNVPQCGYCQSGQLMTAVALLRANPQPTKDEIDVALAGNLCRCGTYPRIRAAIAEASSELHKATA